MDNEELNALATVRGKFRRSRIDLVKGDEVPLALSGAEAIPGWWGTLVDDGRANASRVAEVWRQSFPGEFERVCADMESSCEVHVARLESPEYSGLCMIYVFDGIENVPGVGNLAPSITIGFPPLVGHGGSIERLPEEVRRFYRELHDGLHTNVSVGGRGVPRSVNLGNGADIANLDDEDMEFLVEPVPYVPKAADLIVIWCDFRGGLFSLVDVSRTGENFWQVASGILNPVDDVPPPRSTALNEIEEGILPEIGWYDRDSSRV